MHNLDFLNPRLSERFFVVSTSSDNRGWTVAGILRRGVARILDMGGKRYTMRKNFQWKPHPLIKRITWFLEFNSLLTIALYIALAIYILAYTVQYCRKKATTKQVKSPLARGLTAEYT